MLDEELVKDENLCVLDVGSDSGGECERKTPVIKPVTVVRESLRRGAAMHKVGTTYAVRIDTHDGTIPHIYYDRGCAKYRYMDRLVTVKIGGSSCWYCYDMRTKAGLMEAAREESKHTSQGKDVAGVDSNEGTVTSGLYLINNIGNCFCI